MQHLGGSKIGVRIGVGVFVGIFLLAPRMLWAAGGAEGFHVGLSGLKYDTSAKGDSFAVESWDARTLVDVKLGYLSQQIYYGVVYSSLLRNTSTDNPSRTATGVTLGYHNDGLFFDLSYYLSSEYVLSSTLTLKEGSGLGVEFGYNIMLSGSTYAGVELTYKSLTYKKLSVSGTDSTATNTITELAPMFNVGFYF